MNMSPNQRKEYLKSIRVKQRLERVKANKLIDDQELIDSVLNNSHNLPVPSKVALPLGMTDSLFGRLLSITEFFHCFYNLLIESSLDDSDHEGDGNEPLNSGFIKSAVDSLVPGLGEADYADQESMGIDDEEEAHLTELTAPLPEITIRSLRQLGIQYLLDAVTSSLPSARDYRFMARPLGVLLRLLLRNEELGVCILVFFCFFSIINVFI